MAIAMAMAMAKVRCPWDDVEMASASEWQRGIVDGSVEIPFWSQETQQWRSVGRAVAKGLP
jgi:hypothetical protein